MRNRNTTHSDTGGSEEEKRRHSTVDDLNDLINLNLLVLP
jgi:hypothetical protein